MNFDSRPEPGDPNHNPYASPASASASTGPLRRNFASDGPYVSARGKAVTVCVFFVAACLSDAYVAWTYCNQAAFIQRAKNGIRVTVEEGLENDERILMGSIARLGALGLSTVLLLFWIYRTNRNLSSLGVSQRHFTPGWSVGWWFIPFANLVQPFRAVCEIWRGSDPQYIRRDLTEPGGGTPPLVGCWWGSLMLAAVIGIVPQQFAESKRIDVLLWGT